MPGKRAIVSREIEEARGSSLIVSVCYYRVSDDDRGFFDHDSSFGALSALCLDRSELRQERNKHGIGFVRRLRLKSTWLSDLGADTRYLESRASVVLPGCARPPRGGPGFFCALMFPRVADILVVCSGVAGAEDPAAEGGDPVLALDRSSGRQCRVDRRRGRMTGPLAFQALLGQALCFAVPVAAG